MPLNSFAHNDVLPVIVGVLAVPVLAYLYLVLRAKRAYVRYKLRTILAAEAVFLLVAYYLQQVARWSAQQAVLTAALSGLVVGLAIPKPKISHRIPAAVRRRVIARDLKGDRFDPKKHHIDHIVPWSRWGGNTEDNLRVVSKSENLRKGAKMPRLRDWF